MSLKNVGKVIITGNTYNCRDDIKKLGGRWDGERKAWVVDIAGHALNTMRGRGQLDSALRALANKGCRVSYE